MHACMHAYIHTAGDCVLVGSWEVLVVLTENDWIYFQKHSLCIQLLVLIWSDRGTRQMPKLAGKCPVTETNC